MATAQTPVIDWGIRFADAFESFDPASAALVLTHHDADGLTAAAIVHRALREMNRKVAVRILGRGENPWDDGIRKELGEREMGGLIVIDLGVRAGTIRAETPTIIIDHHRPLAEPESATVLSGYGLSPTPTSGLLALWCMRPMIAPETIIWLAAISIIGDMEENSGFEELSIAAKKYGITSLRKATSLLNAARRSASGIAQPAFDLLIKADGPADITSGKFPETELLLRAREEVSAAVDAAKRIAPRVKGRVALIMMDTPCQIHPLIAQQWKARLHKNIVMAANKGYRPGWVHFSIRSATGADLLDFLKEQAPSTADSNYGSGHAQATGGALRNEAWNEFISKLGFGAEAQVTE